MQDYGILIQLNDGEKVLKAYYRLLKVFLCLNPKHEYVRSMAAHLYCLEHWKANADAVPFWDMFRTCPSMFDESRGEISLSTLSRATNRDSERHKIEHITKKYRQVRMYFDVKEDLVTETKGNITGERCTHYVVKDPDEQAAHTEAFLRQTANNARHCSYRVYDSDRAFPSAASATEHSRDPKKDRRRRLRGYKAMLDVKAVKAHVEHQVCREWATKPEKGILDAWPEYKHKGSRPPLYERVPEVIDLGSDSDANASDGIGEAKAQPVPRAIKPARKRQKKRSRVRDLSKLSESDEDEVSPVDPGGKEEQTESSSDDDLRPRLPRRVNRPRDFRTKGAATVTESEKFDELLAKWHTDNPGKKVTSAVWYQIGDKARALAFEQSGNRSKRTSAGRQRGAFASASSAETDLAAALKLSAAENGK